MMSPRRTGMGFLTCQKNVGRSGETLCISHHFAWIRVELPHEFGFEKLEIRP